jgi:hypothetical protein
MLQPWNLPALAVRMLKGDVLIDTIMFCRQEVRALTG